MRAHRWSVDATQIVSSGSGGSGSKAGGGLLAVVNVKTFNVKKAAFM